MCFYWGKIQQKWLKNKSKAYEALILSIIYLFFK